MNYVLHDDDGLRLHNGVPLPDHHAVLAELHRRGLMADPTPRVPATRCRLTEFRSVHDALLTAALGRPATRRCTRCHGPVSDPANVPEDGTGLCLLCADNDEYPEQPAPPDGYAINPHSLADHTEFRAGGERAVALFDTAVGLHGPDASQLAWTAAQLVTLARRYPDDSRLDPFRAHRAPPEHA